MENYYRTNIKHYFLFIPVIIGLLALGTTHDNVVAYLIIAVWMIVFLVMGIVKTYKQRVHTDEIMHRGKNYLAEVRKIIKCKHKHSTYYILEVEAEEGYNDKHVYYSEPLYNYAYRRKHIPTTVRVYKFGKEVFVDFNTVPNATAFPLDVKQEKFKIAFHNKFLYLLVTVMPFAALFILK